MGKTEHIKSLGVLSFNEEGILFAGDSVSGAIHAFDLSKEHRAQKSFSVHVYEIDAQIAAILGTKKSHIQINDIAVHPISQNVYLSISRGHGLKAQPAMIMVNEENQLKVIDLSSLERSTQKLAELPDFSQTIALRGVAGSPPTKKDIRKSKYPLRMLTIVALEFFEGELFVAGINNEEFCSVLRRIPYPFMGSENIYNVEMYHIVHDQYESRAPIRAMAVKTINNKPQMVAAYTCSPLVLIPLDTLKSNRKVKARTIGDMGNGQPIDMVPFEIDGEEMLFVTNKARSPLVIPVKGLENAKTVTEVNFERGAKLDLHPQMPYGPIGKSIMFSGASLRIALLNKKQFVSLNRDFETGTLDLETVLTKIPFKMHNIIGDGDIPKVYEK
jgi:hypothetical protein